MRKSRFHRLRNKTSQQTCVHLLQFQGKNRLAHLLGHLSDKGFKEWALLTFRNRSRPSAVILTCNYRLALHHVLRIAIKLNNISSFIRRSALSVTISRLPGVEALNLGARWKRSAPFPRWQTNWFGRSFQTVTRGTRESSSATNFSADNSNAGCSAINRRWNRDFSTLHTWQRNNRLVKFI